MYARIAIAVLIAALATACGGSSEGGDATSTTEAAPDPATTKCSDFATMDADAQSAVVAKAVEAKEGQDAEIVLPMVVGLCDQLPDATVAEVLAGPNVVTPVPAPAESPATPTP